MEIYYYKDEEYDRERMRKAFIALQYTEAEGVYRVTKNRLTGLTGHTVTQSEVDGLLSWMSR